MEEVPEGNLVGYNRGQVCAYSFSYLPEITVNTVDDTVVTEYAISSMVISQKYFLSFHVHFLTPWLYTEQLIAANLACLQMKFVSFCITATATKQTLLNRAVILLHAHAQTEL